MLPRTSQRAGGQASPIGDPARSHARKPRILRPRPNGSGTIEDGPSATAKFGPSLTRGQSSMRHLLGTMLLGLAISAFPASAPAQSPGAVGLYSGPKSVYGAPGNYGTTYGVPSYGMRRTYSAFPSPYGAGYGYGYAPTSFL